jgi:hypothetical protein
VIVGLYPIVAAGRSTERLDLSQGQRLLIRIAIGLGDALFRLTSVVWIVWLFTQITT